VPQCRRSPCGLHRLTRSLDSGRHRQVAPEVRIRVVRGPAGVNQRGPDREGVAGKELAERGLELLCAILDDVRALVVVVARGLDEDVDLQGVGAGHWRSPDDAPGRHRVLVGRVGRRDQLPADDLERRQRVAGLNQPQHVRLYKRHGRSFRSRLTGIEVQISRVAMLRVSETALQRIALF